LSDALNSIKVSLQDSKFTIVKVPSNTSPPFIDAKIYAANVPNIPLAADQFMASLPPLDDRTVFNFLI
jgi:hypothetical protein